MRKLFRSAATLGLPLIATALLSSCQPRGARVEDKAQAESIREANKTQELGVEKAGVVDDLLKACGFECVTLASGNASIAGNAKIDAYFQSVLSLKAATASLEGEVNATLGDMALLVGADAGASSEATAASIQAAFNGEFGANFKGGLKLKYQPPQCSVSADVAVQAQAQCEAKVDPGKVEVECHGECVAKADVMVKCDANVDLMCRGTAPSFKCEGECSGSCELDAGVKCEGSCSGKCEFTAAGNCDGECKGSTDSGGKCTGECEVRAGGTCEGECKGSCELSGGASCKGKCKGECYYTAPDVGCEGSAQASCKGKADASVHCEGECKGDVKPPSVDAKCEASVKAQAQFSAECTPPDVRVEYAFAANVSASNKVKLDAQVQAFGKLYGKLLAKRARLNGILDATANLAAAGRGAITELAGELSSSSDAKVVFHAGCAVKEIEPSVQIVADSGVQLKKTVGACGAVATAIGDQS